MTIERILPIAMIALSVGASGVYAYGADWRHALYWATAAVITVSVTF